MRPLNTADVLIAGGGPAGLAAAIAARMRGLSALVADARLPAIDKPCGEGLMPDGVAALRRLGVDPTHATAFPLRGVRFIDGEHFAEANFPAGPGLGMRRTRLHALLLHRAEEVGVATAWGCPVTAISWTGIETEERSFYGRWIVGADGIQSQMRRWLRLEALRRDKGRYGFRAHYRVAPWSEYVEIYWGAGFQAYVTPVAPGEVCIAVLSSNPRLRVAHAVANIPALRERLPAAPEPSTLAGSVTANRKLRAVFRGSAALIGDAAGSVDAITGQGMCLAFQQAADLGDALAEGDLRSYAESREKLFTRPYWMAEFLLALNARPAARRRVLDVFRARPEIFRALLSAHVGAASGALIASGAINLGWELLAFKPSPNARSAPISISRP